MAVNPQTQIDQSYATVRVASDGTSDGTTDPDSYREGRATATSLSSTTTGLYSVTLNPGVDEAECVILGAATAGAANVNVQFDQTSDTNINVRTYVGTVLTNMGWQMEVRKKRSHT